MTKIEIGCMKPVEQVEQERVAGGWFFAAVAIMHAFALGGGYVVASRATKNRNNREK